MKSKLLLINPGEPFNPSKPSSRGVEAPSRGVKPPVRDVELLPKDVGVQPHDRLSCARIGEPGDRLVPVIMAICEKSVKSLPLA
jgi:hypothetical protein